MKYQSQRVAACVARFNRNRESYMIASHLFFALRSVSSSFHRRFRDEQKRKSRSLRNTQQHNNGEQTCACVAVNVKSFGSTSRNNGTGYEQKRTYRRGAQLSIWFKSICHL